MDLIYKERLHAEKNLLEDDEKFPPNVKVKFGNIYNYIVQIQGRQGSTIEGSWIIADIILPYNFPFKAPLITFRNNFQHINIYIGNNKLCMTLVNDLHWSTTTTLLDIINGLDQVMHNPTFNDPANGALKEMYQKNPMDLEKFMIEQNKQMKDKQILF